MTGWDSFQTAFHLRNAWAPELTLHVIKPVMRVTNKGFHFILNFWYVSLIPWWHFCHPRTLNLIQSNGKQNCVYRIAKIFQMVQIFIYFVRILEIQNEYFIVQNFNIKL